MFNLSIAVTPVYTMRVALVQLIFGRCRHESSALIRNSLSHRHSFMIALIICVNTSIFAGIEANKQCGYSFELIHSSALASVQVYVRRAITMHRS